MPGTLRSFLPAALVLAGLSNAQTTTSSTIPSSTACPSQGGAHIIVARASLEPEGYGIIGAVKDQVLARVPGSTAEYVQYPATLGDYFNSETTGVVAMRSLINNYTANCPNLPLVLMGYSQGAQVTADSLVGQNDVGFTDNSTVDTPLPASTLAQTAAVVIMGDPSFVVNETFHVGNATKNGLFPRHNVDSFDMTNLASRMKSYCDAGDPYCAGGNFSTLSVHLGYVGEYGAAAEDFVVAQIMSFYANSTIPMNGTYGGTGTYSGMSYQMTSTKAPSASATATASRTASTASGYKIPASASAPPKVTGTASRGVGTGYPTGSTPPKATGSTIVSPLANSAASVHGFGTVGVLLGGVLAWML